MASSALPNPDQMAEMMRDLHERTAEIVLSQEEAMAFLSLAARNMAHDKWCNPFVCETCNTLARVWWDVCNELSRVNRVKVQRALQMDGVPLPPSPVDLVVVK